MSMLIRSSNDGNYHATRCFVPPEPVRMVILFAGMDEANILCLTNFPADVNLWIQVTKDPHPLIREKQLICQTARFARAGNLERAILESAAQEAGDCDQVCPLR